ncbi:Glycosyltransferase [Methanosarcina siciliae C2J]|uniref:Glycosyltransferase n=3 Tax=Methanosarcina siciliae TaxID=38027 RepID=A0A0E3L8S4_9EURY|nr:Glycosyltransferase [Methanosarcina siciliae T4/M]AKB36600.1 Glycosyltransferase [Methanosarcina siciliae C2J]
MNYPKVTIILLNWNGKNDTIECLESLKNITYSNYDILLIDNGSTDGSPEFFRQKYPEIEVIENGENLGFAEGNNVGMKRAIEKKVDYVLLLNNDTIVDPEFLTELIKVAENYSEVGIVGPKVYFHNNHNRIQSVGGTINYFTGRTPLIGCNVPDHGQYDKTREVGYVSGCALLARIDVMEKLGFLCSDYFAYYEEVELCIKAKYNNFKVVYVPNSKIWHKEAVTSKKSNYYTYLYTRNRFIFMKRNGTPLQIITSSAFFFTTYFIINSLNFITQKNTKNLKNFYKGIYDGLQYQIR